MFISLSPPRPPQVLVKAGSEKEREYAAKIIPVRTNGNLLLCTLLLGNTVVNNSLSVLLADLTTGAVGIASSVFLVLVFGELIPQAAASRYGLFLGAHLVWLLRIFRAILLPVAWPISWILNRVMGREIGRIMNRQEFIKLVELHSEEQHRTRSTITPEDHTLVVGVLRYSQRTVGEVMTGYEKCYKLNVVRHWGGEGPRFV